MSCPMFIDYVRECVEDIKTLPSDIFNYCHSDDYENCPFYIRKQNKIGTCEFIDKCPFFNNFNMNSYDRFIEITKNFCLSSNHIKCERFKLRKSGKEVPIDLKPDGVRIELKS